jgi:hypothetical protein
MVSIEVAQIKLFACTGPAARQQIRKAIAVSDRITAETMYYTVRMAMGKRKRDRQPAMWVTTTDLPSAASHPFYRRLNQRLREHTFDDFAEAQCAAVYAETMGRPGLPPGIYFRLLLIGYFEGIDSERGIAWRATDSLALRTSWASTCTMRRPTTQRFLGRVVSLPSKRIARCSRGWRSASGMPG